MAQETITESIATENNEILSLLKLDEQGWKTELFKTKKEDALCVYCQNVCCDAVELDCEHNDNEIFPHCSVCLQQLISNNDGKCPINSHSDPVIHTLRSLRRQILQCIVYCPFSVKTNAQNDNKSYKCDWNGPLNDLITQHIFSCAQKSDPLLLLQSKLKDSQNKNNFLNIIVNEQKQKIIELKKENDVLNEKNKNLNLSLAEKNKLIEQYEQNTEIKEVENKTENISNEYWMKCGSGMTINESIIEYKGNYGYCTVYSRQVAEDGLHEWKIKILQRSSGCSVYIGIASTMNHCGLLFCGKGGTYDKYNIGYSGYDALKINYENVGIKYGEKYDKGDVITVCLDLNERNISFQKNDKDFGVAFHDIYLTGYRLAVSMYAWAGDNGSVQMISYVNK